MINITLGTSSADAKIVIDGVDVTRYIKGVSISQEAGKIPDVHLQLIGRAALQMDGEAQLVIEKYVPKVEMKEHVVTRVTPYGGLIARLYAPKDVTMAIVEVAPNDYEVQITMSSQS